MFLVSHTISISHYKLFPYHSPLSYKLFNRFFLLFRQIFERDIHNYADSHRIVNFTEHRYFIFDEEKTKLSLDDNITVVNVPYAVSFWINFNAISSFYHLCYLQALGSIIPKYVNEDSVPFFGDVLHHLSYRSINSFLERHEQDLFVNTTVRELIYGYKLDFLDTALSYGEMLKNFGVEMKPSKFLPNNSFGILNGRNGTPDGPYEMYTGLGGTHDQFGIFKTWNGIRSVTLSLYLYLALKSLTVLQKSSIIFFSHHSFSLLLFAYFCSQQT